MKEELLRVAARVVDTAASMDICCEAFVQKKRHTSIIIESGKVTFGSMDGDYGIGIRVINGRNTGYAYCDERSIEFGLKQALSVARLSAPGCYGFQDDRNYAGTRSIYDNRVATLVTEDGIDLARDIIEGACYDPRVTPSRGGLSFGTLAYAVANSNGVSVYDEGTFLSGSVMTVLKEDGVMVNGDDSQVSRSRDFSFEEIGRKATEKAIGQLGQQGIETATMDVILRPDAAFDILSNTVLPSLNGDAVRKGDSVYVDKMGKPVAAGGITIVDDARHPKGLNTFATDEEGYPSRRTVLADNGVLTGLLYDTYAAIEAGAKPTGNAMHGDRMETGTTYKVSPSTCARNFILEGETMPEEEMIRGVRNGILVDNVLGAHTANKISGDFSVAIYAGHAIRDGEIAFPLKGGMIGGNMPAMLLQAALADDYRLVESGFSPASGYIPSIKFSGVRVSGG
ncbi:MAG: protease TldD [Methanocella sp. PtaU1.Bin125]|nr:MAG: protease TldD [Methanocella sp. PtaU1.Bin125]